MTLSPLEQIKSKLHRIKPDLQEHCQITRLGVFGSYVRGEQTETSDVDILVEFSPEFRFGLFTFCELEDQLSKLLNQKVDLVMKDALKPHIGAQILREVIYI